MTSIGSEELYSTLCDSIHYDRTICILIRNLHDAAELTGPTEKDQSRYHLTCRRFVRGRVAFDRKAHNDNRLIVSLEP